MYRITIDREACDGVFACLVRDDRFVESAEPSSAENSSGRSPREQDGLAAIEVDDAQAIAATFDDDRRESAEQAAAACPLDAISVTDAESEEPPQVVATGSEEMEAER